MKIINTTNKQLKEIEPTPNNIVDEIIKINALNKFKIDFSDGVLCIENNDTTCQISIIYINEILVGEGWIRIDMKSLSNVTLFDFGKIRTFNF